MPASRLVFDVSSLARWAGPPGGIIRVESELLRATRVDRPDVVLAVFDPDRQQYRLLLPAWRDAILGEEAAVVLSDGPVLARRGWRAVLPGAGDVFFALERQRLTTRRRWWASTVDRVERLAARAKRHSIQLTTPEGHRFAYVPGDLALGEALTLGPTDTILTAGYDWLRKSPADVARLKKATGVRYVVTCYDTIPMVHPEFYLPEEVQGFRDYWRGMLPVADAVVTISNRTRADLEAWATTERLPLPPTAVVPLTSSIGRPGAPVEPTLPCGLEPGRFILMVGTIEPRKAHALMIEVWRDLLARGVPQRTGFALVFAGRCGWMTESVMRDVRSMSGQRLIHLDGPWDAQLERLYTDCAFTVMPSAYEGFGLPAIESFSHGKAMVASTGGALPEVVNGLSPCLDPGDRAAWTALIEHWILEPSATREYEARIRTSFHRRDWRDVAAGFWDAAAGSRPV